MYWGVALAANMYLGHVSNIFLKVQRILDPKYENQMILHKIGDFQP